MPESPLASSPYEVLGVPDHASLSDLRRAYRLRLRATHPDTGGKATEFDLVQRAWEQVGTPEARAAYDNGILSAGDRGDAPGRSWAPPAPAARAGSSRPPARSFGHAGGWYRGRYQLLLREWVGPGVPIPDPYDRRLVQSAPREVRRLLASAIAEEDTFAVLAGLGMGFTVWNDVLTDPKRHGESAKIDHIVLGPSGLWGMISADWGDTVAARGGELVGPGISADERPLREFADRARSFSLQAKVAFSALAIIVPDDASAEGVTAVGSIRGAQTLLVERARLAHLVRIGLPGVVVGGTQLFELRTRVQAAARFVELDRQS